MNVSYSKELTHAFVVSPNELKKLVELLQKRIGKVEINTGCADDFSRAFNTLKELIAYENPKPKEIRSIHLRSRSDDYSKSVTIVFRYAVRYRTRVSIDITGREDVVFRLKEEMLDIIGGMHPWYGVIHSVNFFYVFLISWLILFIIRIFSYISALALKFKWVPVDEILTSLAELPRDWLLILGILSLVLAFFSNKLRDFFFPPAVIMIGQGESRFKYKERFQWVVIIGFGVSFAASLIVLIITIFF